VLVVLRRVQSWEPLLDATSVKKLSVWLVVLQVGKLLLM
jgi:hypothetical protein